MFRTEHSRSHRKVRGDYHLNIHLINIYSAPIVCQAPCTTQEHNSLQNAPSLPLLCPYLRPGHQGCKPQVFQILSQPPFHPTNLQRGLSRTGSWSCCPHTERLRSVSSAHKIKHRLNSVFRTPLCCPNVFPGLVFS